MVFSRSAKNWLWLALAGVAWQGGSLALADWPENPLAARPKFWEKPTMTRPLTQYEKLERAGKPHCVAWWAQPNYDKYDDGYYVGGGAGYGGEPGTIQEGTWGWDYCHPLTKVRLGYHHGWRYQQGGGLYEPNSRNNPGDHFFGTYQPSGFGISVKKPRASHESGSAHH